MKILRIVALGVLLAAAGCASDGGLPGGESTNGVANGNYEAVASCVALALDMTGVTKMDLPAERLSKLALVSGGVRYWQVTFADVGARKAAWKIEVVQTMFGPLPKIREAAVAAISRCEKGAAR